MAKTLIEFRNAEQFCGVLELNETAFPNGELDDIVCLESIAQAVMGLMGVDKPYADVYKQKDDDIVLSYMFRTHKV